MRVEKDCESSGECGRRSTGMDGEVGYGACRSEESSGRHGVSGVAITRAAIKTQEQRMPCTGARVHDAGRIRAEGARRGPG